jgi:hypothetical protein
LVLAGVEGSVWEAIHCEEIVKVRTKMQRNRRALGAGRIVFPWVGVNSLPLEASQAIVKHGPRIGIIY